MLNVYNAKDIQDKKVTALIYAPPGMGKTTTIKYLPGKTLLLDIDRTSDVLKGCNNIDICKVDNINTWTDWSNAVQDLVKNYKGKYDNIVVDNISELERCILSDLGSKGKNNGVPSQGDYQYLQFKMTNSLRYMKTLECNIVWTAWEMTNLYIDCSGQQWNKTYPQINQKIMYNICGLCDIVAKLTINDKGERGFLLFPTETVTAKNQIDSRPGCLQSELMNFESKTIPDKPNK